MKVTGKIENILQTQTGTTKAGKQWKKTSFVVKTDDEYNNLYCFDVFGEEKVDKFLQYNSKGDVVDVDFNVKTNEWKGKYYTTLQSWRCSKDDAQTTAQETVQATTEDDLPF